MDKLACNAQGEGEFAYPLGTNFSEEEREKPSIKKKRHLQFSLLQSNALTLSLPTPPRENVITGIQSVYRSFSSQSTLLTEEWGYRNCLLQKHSKAVLSELG